MKKLVFLFLFISTSLMGDFPSKIFPLYASLVDNATASEHSGIFIRDLKICHQGDWRNLSLLLEYETKANEKDANIIRVKAHVRTFLEDYSNTTDFWEVMNTKLVHSLIQEFPEINALSSILSLKPDKSLSFPRNSIVRFSKELDILKESFSFTKLNYLICNVTFQKLDLHVAFDLKNNPTVYDYPDYQWIDQAMDEFFTENPISFSLWSDLKPKLEAFLLNRFSTLTSISIEVSIANP